LWVRVLTTPSEAAGRRCTSLFGHLCCFLIIFRPGKFGGTLPQHAFAHHPDPRSEHGATAAGELTPPPTPQEFSERAVSCEIPQHVSSIFLACFQDLLHQDLCMRVLSLQHVLEASRQAPEPFFKISRVTALSENSPKRSIHHLPTPREEGRWMGRRKACAGLGSETPSRGVVFRGLLRGMLLQT
jgi:hypothetical protein